MTTENYLNDLIQQKKNLVANLSAMGVEANETEQLNTLVPKVLDIPFNAVSGSFTPTADTTVQTITDLPFTPVRFSIQAISSYPDTANLVSKSGYILLGCFDSTITNNITYVARFNALVNNAGSITQLAPTIAKAQYTNASTNMQSQIGCGENSFYINGLTLSGYALKFKAGVTYYWTASK